MSRLRRRHLDQVARMWALCALVGWIVLLALVIGLAANTSSAAAATSDSEEAALLDPDQPAPKLEQRRATPQVSADRIERNVMCPSCDTTLDQSESPAAQRMRAWVYAAVDAGWTESEIKDGLVAEYGGDESVLATPRATGLGLLVWIVPAIVIFAMLAIGIGAMLRWRRAQRQRMSSGSGSASSTTSQSASSSSSS